MWTDDSSGNNYNVSYKKFNGKQVKSLKVSYDQEIIFNFDSKVNKGNLIIEIKNEKGDTLVTPLTNQKDVKKIKIDYDGKLFINVIGEDTSGYFYISYNL